MHEPFAKTDIKIAVIGGGTGSFTLLSALKEHTKQLAAIVNMVDDGGSTGVLRDELGTLPPGDVRQCLVALSNSPKVRDLFNYRFDEGTFGGHSFGNILLTALEKVTGNFSEAVETASEILRVKGTVIPSTLDSVRLRMQWEDISLELNGERIIDAEHFKQDPRKATLSLVPAPAVNPTAVAAIEQADIVVIAPGDLYTSLGPLLVIPEISAALAKTDAVCIYMANLVTKVGQTEGFTVSDHASEIQRFAGHDFLDFVIYNNQVPTEAQSQRYAKEQAVVVPIDDEVLKIKNYAAVGAPLLGKIAEREQGDKLPVTRSLIRHDLGEVAKAILATYQHHQEGIGR